MLITGHQAFFTREALTAIAATTLANLTAFEQGAATARGDTAVRLTPTRRPRSPPGRRPAPGAPERGGREGVRVAGRQADDAAGDLDAHGGVRAELGRQRRAQVAQHLVVLAGEHLEQVRAADDTHDGAAVDDRRLRMPDARITRAAS